MTNSWRESIFSLAIYFSELPNHDICQVNFDKLLEMLLGVVADSNVAKNLENVLELLKMLLGPTYLIQVANY
jgi:hypothetical protein